MNLLSVLCPKRDSLHSAKAARRREPKGEQQGERNAGENKNGGQGWTCAPVIVAEAKPRLTVAREGGGA